MITFLIYFLPPLLLLTVLFVWSANTALHKVPTRAKQSQDWGNAPDVTTFFGREVELDTLKKWGVDYHCRLVVISGMGGIGKTKLSIKLSKGIQEDFEYTIWRSLRDAPPVTEILASLVKFLSNQQETNLSGTLNDQIMKLLSYLKNHRCLVILDNVDTLLQGGTTYPGRYKEGCEGYEELFKQLAEVSHQSCLILTSREKLQEIAWLEGEKTPVRSLELGGLDEIGGQKIFAEIGSFSGSKEDWKKLVESHNGNPLFLQVLARHIKKFFESDIAKFLQQENQRLDPFRNLLDWHFERLSEDEKEVMYWLAINRDVVTLAELKEDLISSPAKERVAQTLSSLSDKLPLESKKTTQAEGFSLQPVFIEYMTEQLIQQIFTEICDDREIKLLNRHALLKASAKDYVREAQIRTIVKPLLDRLIANFGNQQTLEEGLRHCLSILHYKFVRKPGYATGNVLNLLIQLKSDLTGYDFSQLTVWQAYLQEVELHRVNFADSAFAKFGFTQTFGSVLSVAFSPDGKLLATGDAHGDIRLWQVTSGQLRATCQGHTNWVLSVAFSPDGKTLASGSSDKTVRIWNIQEEDKCVHQLMKGHTNWVWSVAFSPDGEWLASGSDDHTVKLWKPQTGQLLTSLEGPEGHKEGIWSVAFHPNSQILASGSHDKTIKLWEVSSGQCKQTLPGHTDRVLSVTFNSTGTKLASSSEDKTVRVWETNTGKCITTLKEHANWVWSVAFHPQDERILVSSCEDGALYLWNVETGEKQDSLKEHTERVWSVVFNPQGTILASSSDDQTVKLWEVNTEDLGITLKSRTTLRGYNNGVNAIAFDPRGSILVSGSEDQAIRVWHLEKGTEEPLITRKEHTKPVRTVAFSADGKTLASGSEDQTIRLWDTSTNAYGCRKTLTGHTNRIRAVAFSPNGKVLASGSEDSTIRLWDVDSGDCLKILQGHTNWVWPVAFSPNSLLLASGSDDKTVKLWNVQTGQCLSTLLGHTNRVRALAFHPHGEVLASGSEDETIRLWDVKTGQCLETLREHAIGSGVRSVAFSADGRILASGCDYRTLRLWDVSNNMNQIESLGTWRGHDDGVWSVAFSPDGQILASGSHDGTIKLWEVQTPYSLKKILCPQKTYYYQNYFESNRPKLNNFKSLRRISSYEPLEIFSSK